MKKIVFEGTEQEMNNLKALIDGIEFYVPLPKMTTMSERDVWIDKLGHFVSDDADDPLPDDSAVSFGVVVQADINAAKKIDNKNL